LGPLLAFFSAKELETGGRDLTVEDKIKAFSSEDQLAEPLECFRKWTNTGDAEVMYLINVLDVLAHLSDGRDPLAEALVQSIVPAKSIALCFMDLHQMMADSKDKAVSSRMIIWELKRSLLSLLEAGFFDSSLKDDAYAFSSLHTILCRQVTSDVQYICLSCRERVVNEGLGNAGAPYCEASAMVRYITDGVVSMLSSFFENMFRAELVTFHLQEALPSMITNFTEAVAQMPKETHLRNEMTKCLEIVRRAASTLKRSAAAAAAAHAVSSASLAGSDLEVTAKEEIRKERLNLMRSL
jgi:hypothetical protein